MEQQKYDITVESTVKAAIDCLLTDTEESRDEAIELLLTIVDGTLMNE